MKQSKKLFSRAQKVLVGGVNSPVRSFKGVGGTPRFLTQGEGAYVRDVDGQTYIDFVGSWGPLILGHAPAPVLDALQEALSRGWSFGAPVEAEILLAEEVLKRHPGLEKIRFVSSGTEATLSALRLARGVTGRHVVVKFAGCYHGHVDSLLVEAGSGLATLGTPSSAGIPAHVAADTRVLAYNDTAALEELFANEGDSIAAVIVEPVAGNMGVIEPEPDFLNSLKSLTQSHNSLLILDEVMTGFRVGYHSARGRYGIDGDIVTFGKVIGGGLPVGAYAASSHIMNHVAPLGEVYQAGTLSGNPLAMTAGLATLQQLDQDTYQQLDRQAGTFAERLRQMCAKAGIAHTVHQVGSMIGIFFCEGPVRNFKDAMSTDSTFYARFFQAALDEGVSLAPSAYEALFISTAHSTAILDEALDCLERALLRAQSMSVSGS